MDNKLNTLLEFEERLIVQAFQNKYKNFTEIQEISEKDIHKINANLSLTSEKNIAFLVHKKFVNALITFYIKDKYTKQLKLFKSIFEFEEFENPIHNLILVNEIPDLIEELHVAFLNSKFSISKGIFKRTKSKHYLKEFGAVYTLPEITHEIVSETISKAVKNTDAKDLKCLDFACGTGRFYFEAVKILIQNYNLTLKDVVTKSLYGIDIDNVALSILKCKIISLFENIDTETIAGISTNIINRNALLPNISLLPEFKNGLDFKNDLGSVLKKGGFDAVFSNPPYYLLKANNKGNSALSDHFEELQNKIKKEINSFKKSGVYSYSIEGMLNYYQLSIEMILKMTKKGGQIGIICPSSIFADLTSTKLRKYILSKNKLHFIRYYSEAANLFENVAQSTVIFYLEKEGITDDIEVEFDKNKFRINYEVIKTVFGTHQEIPLIEESGWKILEKLSRIPKIKELSYLRNRRGELDLTLYKDCIINSPSDYRLVRGNMITENGLTDKNNEYVDIEKFISKKSSDFREHDFNKKRLVCQQISNVDLKKRMKFTFSESSDILGNSCNYINSLRSFEDLEKLHLLLNSDLLNWRFKITSSNNHINNYEIDELPIPDLDLLNLSDFSQSTEEANIQICKMYGLNKKETEYILGKQTAIKKQKKIRNEIFI